MVSQNVCPLSPSKIKLIWDFAPYQLVLSSSMSAKQIQQPNLDVPVADDVPVVAKGRGRPKKVAFKKKNAVKSDEIVSASDAEGDSANEAISDVASSVEDEDEEIVSADESDGAIAEGTSPEAETVVVGEKTKEKTTKYSVAEIAEVEKITSTNDEQLVLTRRQLDIAIEQERLKSKEGGTRGEKASFKVMGQFDKSYFLELQNQYKQESGAVYTLQAFQSAIDYWMFKHINIGNAYARSAGNLKTKEMKKGGTKVVGVEMPSGFWENDFLCGFLTSPEGKEQLEVAEETMRVKRKTTTNSAKTNKTKEGRSKNVKDAFANMTAEEKAEMIKQLLGGE